jgi:hypothetical protein
MALESPVGSALPPSIWEESALGLFTCRKLSSWAGWADTSHSSRVTEPTKPEAANRSTSLRWTPISSVFLKRPFFLIFGSALLCAKQKNVVLSDSAIASRRFNKSLFIIYYLQLCTNDTLVTSIKFNFQM